MPATTASSSQALKPLQPLKPIKVSSTRYAALASLGPSKPHEEGGNKGPQSQSALLAAKSSAAEDGTQGPGKKEVGRASGDVLMSRNGRTMQKRDGCEACDGATKVEDWYSGEEDNWQVFTSRKRRGSGTAKNSREPKRGTTPPVTFRSSNLSRSKSRGSRSSSSSSDSSSTRRDATPLASVRTFPTSAASMRSPPTPENWDECDPFPVLRGRSPAPETQLQFSGDRATGQPPVPSGLPAQGRPPSLLSVHIKHQACTKPANPALLQLADNNSATGTAPQLEHFSFSKKLDKVGEASGRTRPNINKGFLGQLVRNNEASNLVRENPGDDSPRRSSLGKGKRIHFHALIIGLLQCYC